MTSNRPQSEPYFTVRENGVPPRRMALTDFPYSIGRARDCDLVVDQTAVSRLHAQLDYVHEQVTVTDLGSTNGTFVNRQRLEPHKPRRLKSGDVINLGGECILEFDDPAATATIPLVDAAIPGLVLDEAAAAVSIDGNRLDPPLSPGQFALLQLLVEKVGSVVTREDIRAHVWGPDEPISDQTLDALVSRLRKRLDAVDPTHEYIETRRGFGLIFRNKI
jgi:predicted component of type VI protein secretion system